MEFNQFSMKQTLYEGDLCILDGYGNRIWEVIGFTCEKTSMKGKITEEIIYNLSCIISTEWNIGVQDDTTLVCKSAYAYQYVKELNDEGLPPSYDSEKQVSSHKKKGGTTMTNKPVDKEAKIPYVYPNTIDGLLQKLSDLRCKGEVLGVDNQLQSAIDETIINLANKKQELEH